MRLARTRVTRRDASFVPSTPVQTFCSHRNQLHRNLCRQSPRNNPLFRYRQNRHRLVRAEISVAPPSSSATATESNGVPPRPIEAQQPTLAQRARTVAYVCRSGTLCTKSVRHDGVPFGSHVDYILDDQGCPIFLLAKNAEHTMNLSNEKRCSLFCQNKASAGQGGSRATLVGSISKIEDGDELHQVKDQYTWTHPHAEQALMYPELFEFYRLNLNDIFFAGGYGVDATYVDLGEYSGTNADPLAFDAPDVVNDFNESKHDDLMMICRVFLELDDSIVKASMVTLDHLGFDVRVLLENGSTRQYRIGFREKVQNKFDVDSALMKTLQEAWEKENGFESEWEDEEMRPIGLSSAFEKDDSNNG